MFKLNFPLPSSTEKIHLADPIYLIGSCFSSEIGQLLSSHKFNVFSNPFGILFNPHSIFKTLRGEINPQNTIKSHDVFYHWDAHGEISALDEATLTLSIEQKLKQSQSFMRHTKWLIITLGTSWVYRYAQTNDLVANCHKVPAKTFKKELLDIDFIVEEFETTKAYLNTINPNVKVVLTVSPVRHVKDGLIENNRSKARLLEAAHCITEQFDHVTYFPSYEIAIDELRDYRFYAEDMVHPSAEAVNYIWNRFAETFFDEETRVFLQEWSNMLSALRHRPFLPHSPAHQHFLKQTLKKLETINEKVDVSEEVTSIKSQIL